MSLLPLYCSLVYQQTFAFKVLLAAESSNCCWMIITQECTLKPGVKRKHKSHRGIKPYTDVIFGSTISLALPATGWHPTMPPRLELFSREAYPVIDKSIKAQPCLFSSSPPEVRNVISGSPAGPEGTASSSTMVFPFLPPLLRDFFSLEGTRPPVLDMPPV